MSDLELLIEENKRLKAALAGLIQWAGQSPEGPAWATPDAKKRNRELCEAAITAACNCFPDRSVIWPDGTASPHSLATN